MILLLAYQCEIEKSELKNLDLFNIYSSREILVKKMLYFLESDIGSLYKKIDREIIDFCF